MTHLALKMYNYHACSISSLISQRYVVDQLWFYIISGMDMPEALEVEKGNGEGKHIDEMDRLFQDLAEKYKVYLNEHANMDEVRLLNIPWKRKRETSLVEMMMHIVTHGTYHRGNVTAMLRQMGHASVTTDLTVYWYADGNDSLIR